MFAEIISQLSCNYNKSILISKERYGAKTLLMPLSLAAHWIFLLWVYVGGKNTCDAKAEGISELDKMSNVFYASSSC